MPRQQDWSQQRGLLLLRLLDWSLRLALRIVLQLEPVPVLQAGLLLRVHLAVAAAVQVAGLWQAVAELLPPDSSVPAHPD
jgi:hypothetical protein